MWACQEAASDLKYQSTYGGVPETTYYYEFEYHFDEARNTGTFSVMHQKMRYIAKDLKLNLEKIPGHSIDVEEIRENIRKFCDVTVVQDYAGFTKHSFTLYRPYEPAPGRQQIDKFTYDIELKD